MNLGSALDMVGLGRWMEGYSGPGWLEARKGEGPVFELGSITQLASGAYQLSEL